jgi:plasmid stabilization system protein ParE
VSFRLSTRAQSDLVDILIFTADRFGTRAARRLQARLEARFEMIADGTATGHRRRDLRSDVPLLFDIVRPFVIAFDPQTREIARILHGARNLPTIFEELE